VVDYAQLVIKNAFSVANILLGVAFIYALTAAKIRNVVGGS